MARYFTAASYFWTGKRYELVSVSPVEYPDDAPWESCKGDQVAKQTEMMQQQNMQQQMAFDQQLMGLFQKQFDKQSAVMDYLKGKMTPMIEKPTGYADDALAAMRTKATDTISTNAQNAQRALQSQRFAAGGRDIPSGVDAQLNAALLESESAQKSDAQNTITLQNENLKQTNYWNAINALNGIGAEYNPQSYAASATNAANSAVGAGNSVANLSQAVTASQQSGLMGMLGGLAGGVFGAAGKAGGFGALFCWLAAAHFNGWNDRRTDLVRAWLLADYSKSWYGMLAIRLYALTGRWAARQPAVVKAVGPLFDVALGRAYTAVLNAA